MPPLPPRQFALDKVSLFKRGIEHTNKFLCLNKLDGVREINLVPKHEWPFDVCAYYRPCRIEICLDYCGWPAGWWTTRNWTWPGSTTDREPFGVIAHEVAHHVDWLAGEKRGVYWSDFGESVMLLSEEEPISSYCPNSAEWFAEMMRIFITNHALLRLLRPRTWELLRAKFIPITSDDWQRELGNQVPDRIVRALKNKIQGATKCARRKFVR